MEELERILDEEKASEEILALPPDFYARMNQELSAIDRQLRRSVGEEREMLERKRVLFRDKLEELFSVRLRKVLLSLLEGHTPIGSAEEQRFIDRISQAVSEMRESLLLHPVIQPKTTLVVLEQEIPRIVAEDMRFYGPFLKGDVVALPRKTAELLIKKGLAKRIEVRI